MFGGRTNLTIIFTYLTVKVNIFWIIRDVTLVKILKENQSSQLHHVLRKKPWETRNTGNHPLIWHLGTRKSVIDEYLYTALANGRTMCVECEVQVFREI